MLKIDLHVHTWHSDSTGSVKAVLEVARRKGLDGIAITDHDTLRGAYEALEGRGRLIVIPGEEVKTAQGEILALGVKRLIPKNLSINEAIWRTHTQGGLVVIPHATVPLLGRLREKNLKDLPIDGLEVFSAITPLGGYFLERNLELARRLRVSITVGSPVLEDVLRPIEPGLTSLGGNCSRLVFKLRIVKGLFAHLPWDSSTGC